MRLDRWSIRFLQALVESIEQIVCTMQRIKLTVSYSSSLFVNPTNYHASISPHDQMPLANCLKLVEHRHASRRENWIWVGPGRNPRRIVHPVHNDPQPSHDDQTVVFDPYQPQIMRSKVVNWKHLRVCLHNIVLKACAGRQFFRLS